MVGRGCRYTSLHPGPLCKVIGNMFKGLVMGMSMCLTWIHDDVIKRKHIPCCWPFVKGIRRSPLDSPHKGPVTRSFGVFFDLRLNKLLSKQSRRRWFGTPSRSLWRHCNVPEGVVPSLRFRRPKYPWWMSSHGNDFRITELLWGASNSPMIIMWSFDFFLWC